MSHLSEALCTWSGMQILDFFIWNETLDFDDIITWKYFLQFWHFARESMGHTQCPRKESAIWIFEVFLEVSLNKLLNKQSGEKKWKHFQSVYVLYFVSIF